MAQSASKGVAQFAGQISQTALNTDVWVQIPTGIDPGNGTVLVMESFEVFFRDSHTDIFANNNCSVMASVSRSPVVPSLANTDVFGMVALSVGRPAVGQSVYNPILEVDLEPAITLQPYIYVCLSTSNAGGPLVADYRVTYDTQKVSGNEYLKLLAGGV